MMRVYLDNCCFNRPFDDQSLLTVQFETEAKLYIQEKIKSGHLALGWSYLLDFENAANPFLERRVEIQRWKQLADSIAYETEEILSEMDRLVTIGLKPLDALHVACAIYLECNYFITVDKGILKKAVEISQINVINPMNLVMEWEIQ